jgi:hypothetical protein
MSTLTAQQIYAQQAQRTLALYLYNPKDEPAKATYNAIDYVIPPATECFIKVKRGRVLEKHDEPGVLPIRGYSYIHRETAKSEPQQINISPEQIVEYLVGPDRMSGRLGPAGVRLLTGDPELDEIIKRDARETWLRKTYEDALALRNAHEQVVAAKQAIGQPLPSLSNRTRAAYRTIAAYEANGGEYAVKHTCPKCGDRIKEDADARAHVLAYHRNEAAALLEKLKLSEIPDTQAEDAEAPTVDLPIPPAPKRGPGRPRKVAEA